MTAATVMQSYENVKLYTISLIVCLKYKAEMCLNCVLKVKKLLNVPTTTKRFPIIHIIPSEDIGNVESLCSYI